MHDVILRARAKKNELVKPETNLESEDQWERYLMNKAGLHTCFRYLFSKYNYSLINDPGDDLEIPN